MEATNVENKRVLTGSNSPQWKGGRKIINDGYVAIWMPGYHRPCQRSYVREHIYVMERHLGKWLKSGEIVHHKNGNRQDNRIENLEIMTTQAHCSMHHRVDHSDTICLWCGGKSWKDKRWERCGDGYLCNKCACKRRRQKSM